MIVITAIALIISTGKAENTKLIIKPVIAFLIAQYLNTKPISQGDIQICIDKKTFQRVIIPLKDRFLHTLILGPTGSGKTSQIILPMLNQDLQNPEAGITVIEPKSDLAEKVYVMSQIYGRKCLYFNPQYHNCPRFNPLYGDEDTVIENTVLCFRSILEESPDFFKDTVEIALRNALKTLKRVIGNKTTLIILERFLYDTGGIGQQFISALESLSNGTDNKEKQKENEDIIHYFRADYFNQKSDTFKNTSSLRTQLSRLNNNKYLRKALNPTNGENDINFKEHIEDGGTIAISTCQGKIGLTLSRLLGFFIILNFQSAVFQRAGNENTRRPHFLYIDEFQEFSNPNFGILLTQGRSYRISCNLATQNRQLIAGNGSREGQAFLDLVMTNARNIILFPDLNPDDCEYFSRAFGEKRTFKKSTSRSKNENQFIGYNSFSDSRTEDFERIITTTDISQRPFGEITYKIIINNTAQKASHGKISFLPQDFNSKVENIIAQNKMNLIQN